MRRAAASVLAVTALPIAAATRMPTESWGRAGVSFEQYRADALECGRSVYYADISQTDDAKAFVRGSRELDDLTEGAWQPPPPGVAGDPHAVMSAVVGKAQQYTMAKQSVQPERRIAHLQTMMQAMLDGCLSKRGYVRFRLTQPQRKHLATLPLGSAARHAYMFSLGSDPAILKAQAEPSPQ